MGVEEHPSVLNQYSPRARMASLEARPGYAKDGTIRGPSGSAARP
jgi:hypothetical protein